MRLVLDTHVVLAILGEDAPSGLSAIVEAPDNAIWVSVVSLWEIAIKTRLGKLKPALALPDIPTSLRSSGIGVLDVVAEHVIVELTPEPSTRDPFDRLLLAQCHVENMLLVTQDRAIRDHPLAFRLS